MKHAERNRKNRTKRGIAFILALSLALGLTPENLCRTAYAAQQAEERKTWCRVSGKIRSAWGGNIAGEITITNIGQAPASGWQIDLPWDVRINSLWNGVYEKADGYHRIRAAEYNKTLAAGESVTVGFLAEGDEENLRLLEEEHFVEQTGLQVTTEQERQEGWYREPKASPSLPPAPTPAIIPTTPPVNPTETPTEEAVPTTTVTGTETPSDFPAEPPTEESAPTAAVTGTETPSDFPVGPPTEEAVPTITVTASETPSETPTETPTEEVVSPAVTGEPGATACPSEAGDPSEDLCITADTQLTADTVCRNLTITGGSLRLCGHRLRVQGTVRLLGEGKLWMETEGDDLWVKGDLHADAAASSCLESGTLRLSGDLSQPEGAAPIRAGAAFLLQCRGKAPQTILLRAAGEALLGKLDLWESRGVTIPQRLRCAGITGLSQIRNQDVLELDAPGLVIDREEEIHCSVILYGETKIQKPWAIHGNLTVSLPGIGHGLWLNPGGKLTVDGDMEVAGGQFYLEEAQARIGGGFTLGKQGAFSPYSCGFMLAVEGDCTIHSQYSWTAEGPGTLRVGGDFVQGEDAGAESVCLSGAAELILDGKGEQAIRLSHPDTSRLGRLNLRESAGVRTEGRLRCAGITGLSQIRNQDVLELDAPGLAIDREEEIHCSVILYGETRIEKPWAIHGNLTVCLPGIGHSLALWPGGKLTVDGDMEVAGGQFYLDGEQARIGGGFTLGEQGALSPDSREFTLAVGGDYTIHSRYAWEGNYPGTVRIGGDLVQGDQAGPDSFEPSYSIKIMLDGDQPQVIDLPHTKELALIDITESAGVRFRQNLKGYTLRGIENVITQGRYYCNFDEIETGGDGVFQGDLACRGSLYLSGDHLAIRGNLTQNDGVYLSHCLDENMETRESRLEITGDYTGRCGILDAGSGQVHIRGKAKLQAEAGLGLSEGGLLRIDGDLRFATKGFWNFRLAGGTLQAGGDITRGSHAAGPDLGQVRLKLCGDGPQLIDLGGGTYSFGSIDLRESAGARFASGCIRTDRITGFDRIQNPLLQFHTGELQLEGDETYQGDLTLMDGQVDLAGHTLKIGCDLQQWNRVILNGGKLCVDGSYHIPSGLLQMTRAEDLLQVAGDFRISTLESEKGNLTDGRFELWGNFNQEGNGESFATEGQFEIAFLGETIQDVHFEDNIHSCFARIDPQHAGYRTADSFVVWAGRMTYSIGKGILEGIRQMYGIENFAATAAAAAATLGVTASLGVIVPADIAAVAVSGAVLVGAATDGFLAAQSIHSIYQAANGTQDMYQKAEAYAKDGVIALLSLGSVAAGLVNNRELLKTIYDRLPFHAGAGAGDESLGNAAGLARQKGLAEISQIRDASDAVRFLTGEKGVGMAAEAAREYLRLELEKYPADQIRDILHIMDSICQDIGRPLSRDEVCHLLWRLGESDTRDIRETIRSVKKWMSRAENCFSRAGLSEAIEGQGMTYGEFQRLRRMDVTEMSPAQRVKMKAVREAVGALEENTMLRKTIPYEHIEEYLKDNFKDIQGFIARDQDVCHLVGYDEVREGLRLDYEGTPYLEGGNSYGYIKFRPANKKELNKIEIPYGAEMQGHCTDGPPCTRNGFLASLEEIIPEWLVPDRDRKVKMKDGAELHEVVDGYDKLVAVYDEKEGIFKPV